MRQSQQIAILDLGGQYCHLIARRMRDLGVECAILPPETGPEVLTRFAGIILSGGPQSVNAPDAPAVRPAVFGLGVPILGICYGHQLLAKALGAEVRPERSEYGSSRLSVLSSDTLFGGTPDRQRVWMSHSDSVVGVPESVAVLAKTERCEIAAYADLGRRLFGVQFHPEVVHTEFGREVLRNFVGVCGIRTAGRAAGRVETIVGMIREQVGPRSVFFLVSGGVDSTVAFALCGRALARERVLGLYVDTGLMRQNETAELRANLAELDLADRLIVRDESERFLRALRGITDPEEKRRIIGRLFIDVQAQAMKEFDIGEGSWLLGQGTIYPDTIESGGDAGQAGLIKTHHNRCEEVRHLLEQGLVVEPLAQFYKDEVRQIGRELGLSERLTERWPFPGPGLAIRCLCHDGRGDTACERIHLEAGLGDYDAVAIPLRTVGVQGDNRTYREVLAVRGPLDYDRLQELSTTVCNVGATYNRVIVQIWGTSGDVHGATLTPGFLGPERVERLRAADHIVRQRLEAAGLTRSVWQCPVVLIPLSYGRGESIVVRPVSSEDGMTASVAELPQAVLTDMAREIGGLGGVDAVWLDVTNKPPATIEWE